MKKSELRKIIKEVIVRSLQESKSSDKDFVSVELDEKEFNELDKIISSIGGDLDVALEADLEEAPKVEHAALSINQLEKGGYVLKVSKTVLANIDEFVEAGLHAKDWYNNMSKSIKDALGDSEGCLFLMIFAAFSPRNAITKNFRQASKFFHGVMDDIKDNPDLLHAVLNSKTDFKELHARLKADDESILKLKTFSNINNTGVLPNYYPNLGRILDLYKKKNYKLNTDDVFNELSSTLDTNTGSIKSDNTILSAEKVLSFAMNFIKPDGYVGENWFPVTIDTWMASLFYPKLTSSEKNKMLGKRQNYVYLSKHVQKLAKRYGMLPQEMQAVLWVGKMLKTSPNLVTTMDEVFDNLIDKFELQIEHMKGTEMYFKNLITEVGKS